MKLHRIVAASLLLLAAAGTASAGPGALDQGVFLVATDKIQEGNFSRTVVLLLTYGAGGAVGVIVNRPSSLPLARLLPDVDLPSKTDVMVWQGGPVEPGRMLYLVRSEDDLQGAARVFGEIQLSHDMKLLDKVLRKKKFRGRFRILAGYAGWAPGQLEGEIRRGGWMVVPASAADVFTEDPLGLWDRFGPERGVYRKTGLEPSPLRRYSSTTGSASSSLPPSESPNRMASSIM